VSGIGHEEADLRKDEAEKNAVEVCTATFMCHRIITAKNTAGLSERILPELSLHDKRKLNKKTLQMREQVNPADSHFGPINFSSGLK
jgi:hypothetical protein